MSLAREKLHQLLDKLPEQELLLAEQLLEPLHEARPFPHRGAIYGATWDDEPETADEKEAVDLARQQQKRGELISDEELGRLLGHER